MARATEGLLGPERFDQIVLDEANGGSVLNVYPLDLPDRQNLATGGTGTLRIRLLERPSQTYEIRWTNIARVRLYEQMLLEKALELTEGARFHEAFDYFARLLADYPDLPGLGEQVNKYLEKNALASYRAGEYNEALAILSSLYDRNPSHRGLTNAVEKVAGQIIQERLKERDYAGARAVLDLWSKKFPQIATSSVNEWQQRFHEASTRSLNEAEQYLQNGQYVAAERSARLAAAIWPDADRIQRVLTHIYQKHPQVMVGVLEQSPSDPTRRIDSWPSLRVAPLVKQTICELDGYTPEGGSYRSHLGTLSIDDPGRRLTIKMGTAETTEALRPKQSPAHALARTLLAMADPGAANFHRGFAAVCDGIAVEDAATVHIDLARPHVRPEALLQSTPVGSSWETGAARTSAENDLRFALEEFDDRLVRFEAQNAEGPVLRSIVERKMSSDEEAVVALLRGDVSVLDRVPPWQLARLEAAEGIEVGTYLLPTLHVLIPNMQKPLLAQREFRRALCFGIDRDRIVKEVIGADTNLIGFQTSSGPFLPGKSLSDPIRYAYNTQIAERGYEPRLAATLSLVAAAAVAKLEGKETAGADLELPHLVLAHSSDALTRTTCGVIEQQLNAIGIPIELREVSTDVLIAEDVEYDLRYAELAVWEPTVDARILFDEDGLTRNSSSTMRFALRSLDEAGNWNDVRQRLGAIHRIAHNDLPVIPLWQSVNHFAFRSELVGVGDSLVTLYQHISRWRPAGQ